MKRYITAIMLCCLAIAATAKKTTPKAKAPDPEPEEEPTLIDKVSEDKQAMARDMLDRVEKIKLVAAIRVDAEDFFTNYYISADAGDLLDRTALPPEVDATPAVVYRTQNGKELFWAQPDDGHLTLMTCLMLDNGTALPAVPMGEEYADGGGDSDYPFVMQDGSTVYFANNGDNSIGGYDIFMTRRSPDGEVLQPQNIGMPFNSPYNDYMMVIDETRNLGWWASDREQIPGKVTIYVFEPNQIRENYPADLDNIGQVAMLEAGAVTPTGDLEQRIASDSVEYVEGSDSDYDLGDYESLTDPQARQAARQLLEYIEECDRSRSRLALLRARYAGGDTSVAGEIREIEASQLKWPVDIKRMRNKVMSLQNK